MNLWRRELAPQQAVGAIANDPLLYAKLVALIEAKLSTSGQSYPLWHIVINETIEVKERQQYVVHNIFKLDGTLILNDESELWVL